MTTTPTTTLLDTITLPRSLFESPQYRRLTAGQKAFLIQLHVEHGDAAEFTIPLLEPARYGLNAYGNVRQFIDALLQAGWLTVTRKEPSPVGTKRRRVFALAEPGRKEE